MNLSRLLNAADFKAVWRYVSKSDPQATTSAFAFKQAFDMLRWMQPVEDAGTIGVYKEVDGECSLKIEESLVGEWQKMLSWEIKLADDIADLESTPDGCAEIAAAILWEITFYGFSPEERKEVLMRRLGRREEGPNPYRDKGDERMARRYGLWQKIVARHNITDERARILWDVMEHAGPFNHYDFRTFGNDFGTSGAADDCKEYIVDMFNNWLPRFDENGQLLVIISGPGESEEFDDSINEGIKAPFPETVFFSIPASTNGYMQIDIFAFSTPQKCFLE